MIRVAIPGRQGAAGVALVEGVLMAMHHAALAGAALAPLTAKLFRAQFQLLSAIHAARTVGPLALEALEARHRLHGEFTDLSPRLTVSNLSPELAVAEEVVLG